MGIEIKFFLNITYDSSLMFHVNIHFAGVGYRTTNIDSEVAERTGTEASSSGSQRIWQRACKVESDKRCCIWVWSRQCTAAHCLSKTRGMVSCTFWCVFAVILGRVCWCYLLNCFHISELHKCGNAILAHVYGSSECVELSGFSPCWCYCWLKCCKL